MPTLRNAKTALLLLFALFFSTKDGQTQTDTLRLIFAGDVMGHAPQITSAEVIKNEKYNYEPCFKFVKPLIEQADIAVANLELTLPGKPPYTGYPMFRSPDDLARALKWAGFDILVTANNHSNDSRGLGVKNTIKTLEALNFLHTGTFTDARDRAAHYPLMVYKKGFKLAMLNYTYGTNGVPTEAPTIVNLIDKEQIAKDLAEAVARKPHFIIVVMHWGLEYQLTENEEQRDLARFLISNGADLVIGAHPHVVQPIRNETATLPGGGKKEVLVVYSLGNFISNQLKPHTDGGILFQVELIKKRGSPEVRIGRNGMVPVWRYIHKPAKGKSVYYAVPIARATDHPGLVPGMPDTAEQAMRQFADALRKRIGYRELKL